MGLELIGILEAEKSGPLLSGLNSAARRFSEAALLAPSSAEAVNLAAIVRIPLDYRGQQSQIAQQLFKAVALDPKNETILKNL